MPYRWLLPLVFFWTATTVAVSATQTTRKPDMELEKLTPNMIVEDVRASADWYVDALGMELVLAVPQGTEEPIFSLEGEERPLAFSMLRSGEVEIMLNSFDAVEDDLPGYRRGSGDGITLYIDVEDVDALHEHLKERANVVKPPFTTFYGARELIVRDPNGFALGFAERPERE